MRPAAGMALSFLVLLAGLVVLAVLVVPEPTGRVVGVDVGADLVPIDPTLAQRIVEQGSARIMIVREDGVSVSGASRARGARFSTRDVSIEELEALQRDASVSAIYEDVRLEAFLDESVGFMNATQVWNVTMNGTRLSGSGRSVCVIDTGVDYTHDSLGSCTAQEVVAGSCAKVAGYDFVNSDDDPYDDHGHGTHVAGIVAGNGSIVGVAPGASIIAIKALDAEASGWLSDVMAGVSWCTEHRDEYNITAISMSLGSPNVFADPCDSYNTLWTAIIEDAVAKNVSVVSATGNAGSITGVSFPACASASMRVGALDGSNLAAFTNRGPSFGDIILAPGVAITSAVPGGLGIKSGTSMATPHVSGALALIDEYLALSGGERTPLELEDALRIGPAVHDEDTNMTLRSLDAFAALVAVDEIAPTIELSLNGSATEPLLLFWNVTDDVALENATIELTYTSTTTNETVYEWNATNGSFVIENSSFGTYRASIVAFDGGGNNASAEENFSLKDTANLTLTLNGTTGNVTVHEARNVTIVLSVVGENALLFVNDTLVGETNDTLVYTVSIDSYGTIVVRAAHPETAVYAASSIEYTIVYDDERPIITSQDPEPELTLIENTTTIFSVEASDPLNATLSYRWLIDGIENATNDTLSFTAPIGSYDVAVVVSNEAGNASASWNVTVLPVPVIFFNGSNPIGNVSFVQGGSVTFDLSSRFIGANSSTVYVLRNSSAQFSVSQSSATINSDTVGVERVWIEAANVSSNVFGLAVTAPPPPPSSSGGGSGGGGSSGGSSRSSGGSSIALKPAPELEPEPVTQVQASASAFSVSASLAEPSTDATIKIEAIEQPDVEPVPARVYRYASITVENASADGVNFTFEVDRAWIESEGVMPEDIRLYRYTNMWDELETEFVEERENAYRYTARSSGLSYFAIAAVERVEPVVEIPQRVEVIEESSSRNGDHYTVAVFVVVLLLLVLGERFLKPT